MAKLSPRLVQRYRDALKRQNASAEEVELVHRLFTEMASSLLDEWLRLRRPRKGR